MVLTTLSSIPEDKRTLIRGATNQIQNIANNLLNHHRHRNISDNNPKNNFENPDYSPELISELILAITTEKQEQYKYDGVEIVVNINNNFDELFANISSIDFKRILSNLINNSIESMYNKDIKKVFIYLIEQDNNIVISIRDEGCGISNNILNKIMNDQPVSDKAKGNGLGLSHAKKVIEESWNGQLVIKSQIEKGTMIQIYLPKSSPPEWYISKINLSLYRGIIILDDSKEIHRIWDNRFSDLKNKINILKFYTANEFSNWIEINNTEHLFFFMDYELIDCSENGLDLMEKYSIAAKSILVTGRYDEPTIKKKCANLNVKIIPKNFIESIPIIITASST